MGKSAKRFRAFISYSQKDKHHAKRLHHYLKSYRIPGGVDAPVDPDSRKLGRFFRDDEEMGAATDLGATLQGAISESESLIVIASPNAARSMWVNEEVLHFKRTGREERIFVVIADGEPNASGDPARQALECYPPGLRFKMGKDGRLSDLPTEPFGLDMRKESFRRLCARLAAGLLAIPFDTLWKRDRRRRQKRIAFAAGGGLIGILATGGAAFFYVHTQDIKRVREPAMASYEAAMQAREKARSAREEATRAASLVRDDNDEPHTEGDIEYVFEGYAGGISYRGSRASDDLRWLHVKIHYYYGGALYVGEIPWTDHGQFVGQGGEEETKYGVYYYPANCYYQSLCTEKELAGLEPPFGDYYEGEFLSGKSDGYGVYTFEDGSIYYGQFSVDAISGFGVLETPGGDRWVGQWVRNRASNAGYVHRAGGTIDFGSYSGLTLEKRSPAITPE